MSPLLFCILYLFSHFRIFPVLCQALIVPVLYFVFSWHFFLFFSSCFELIRFYSSLLCLSENFCLSVPLFFHLLPFFLSLHCNWALTILFLYYPIFLFAISLSLLLFFFLCFCSLYTALSLISFNFLFPCSSILSVYMYLRISNLTFLLLWTLSFDIIFRESIKNPTVSFFLGFRFVAS